MANQLTGVPPISREAYDAMGSKEKKQWVPVTVAGEAKFMPRGFVLVTDENDKSFNKSVPKSFHISDVTIVRKHSFEK